MGISATILPGAIGDSSRPATILPGAIGDSSRTEPRSVTQKPSVLASVPQTTCTR